MYHHQYRNLRVYRIFSLILLAIALGAAAAAVFTPHWMVLSAKNSDKSISVDLSFGIIGRAVLEWDSAFYQGTYDLDYWKGTSSEGGNITTCKDLKNALQYQSDTWMYDTICTFEPIVCTLVAASVIFGVVSLLPLFLSFRKKALRSSGVAWLLILLALLCSAAAIFVFVQYIFHRYSSSTASTSSVMSAALIYILGIKLSSSLQYSFGLACVSMGFYLFSWIASSIAFFSMLMSKQDELTYALNEL